MEIDDIARRVELLRQEHRDLDAAIDALVTGPRPRTAEGLHILQNEGIPPAATPPLQRQLIPDIIA